MKFNLNILERVVIMNILPRTGSFVNVRAAKNTGKILMITDEERKELDLQVNGGTTTWNDKGKEEKQFEIPPSSVKIIRDTLKDLDAKGQLPMDAISAYEKFLLGNVPPEEIDAEVEDVVAPATPPS